MEGKREKKRKDISGKIGKEMNERRDDGRQYTELVTHLHGLQMQLSSRPNTIPSYNLRLLPLTVQRSSILAGLELEERHARSNIQIAWDEERERVEEEWRRGTERVRERLMEGIEERRRRAREEKEGEGAAGDTGGLEGRAGQGGTRKLRNKPNGMANTSPPPTPLPGVVPAMSLTNGLTNGVATGLLTMSTIPSGPFLNPHSLSVDEIPSPFPLPLTSTTSGKSSSSNRDNTNSASTPNPTENGGTGGTGGGGGITKRKPKPVHHTQIVGGLGKSLQQLAACKEHELESDLGEIRRGNKRRRVVGGGK